MKTTTQEVIKFGCEICNFTTFDENVIVEHEKRYKQGTCEHKNLNYFSTIDYNYMEINAFCPNCLLCEKLKVPTNNLTLNKIYNLIKTQEFGHEIGEKLRIKR